VLLERYNQQIKIGALGKGNKKQIHYKSFNHAQKKKKRRYNQLNLRVYFLRRIKASTSKHLINKTNSQQTQGITTSETGC
jgi:uncharacterized protein (DUF1919 family)